MSLIDFTASLFRDQRVADAFNDNPAQALLDAGLPDVTPADVQAMLPTVAESMPPDHPLQSLVRPAETSSVVEPEPVDPSVTLDNNDVILQPDEKVYVMQPGDQEISGINGFVIQHPDGSITDVGTDITIVHEDEAYVAGADPNSTKAEEIGEGGLDPRVTTTAEDLGGGVDPRVTTTAEDLGGSDTGWTPYEEAMDWTLQPATLPTTPPELGLGEDPRDSVGIESDDDVAIESDAAEPIVDDATLDRIDDTTLPEDVMVFPTQEDPSTRYEQSDPYAADQSSYESTSATESSAGSEYIG